MFYLHADHLGSTSLATNETGGFVSRVLYYPYGETRYAEGTLPTDRLYTGQRWEQGFGLYDYNARYYDPALGRFISADTIVPDPANPQSLNRFAYVYNNPLRYVDPTGYFTEEEIMGFFGVETWEDVLAFFMKDGSLEGGWGWLETLRRGEAEHFVYFSELLPEYADLRAPLGDGVAGEFVIQDGDLLIRLLTSGAARLVTHYAAAGIGDRYSLGSWRPNTGPLVRAQEGPYVHWFFETPASQQYNILRLNRVDWGDVALDGGGLVADLIAFGIPGRLINGGKFMKGAANIGTALNVAGALKGTGELMTDDVSFWNVAGLAMDGLGFFCPLAPDAIGLMIDFGQAFSP